MLISTFLNSERQLRSGWWILLFFVGLASLLVPTLLIAQQHEMDVSISWQAAIVLLVSILCSCCDRNHWLNCSAILMCAGLRNFS